MMTINSGEFWVAEIIFTSGISSKKRPVLILWCDGDDVLVAVVTSAQPRSNTDIQLTYWKESGLKVPSTVRLFRLDCLEKSLLLAKIGRISDEDAKNILNTWSLYVKPQF